jgi:hypothetical protein
LRLPLIADGVGAQRSLTVMPGLRRRAVLSPLKPLEGTRDSNRPRQSPHGEPAMDGKGNDCQASLRHRGMTGEDRPASTKNTAFVALSAVSRRGSGVRVWRVSAETWPCGSGIGHTDALRLPKAAIGHRLPAVSGRRPAVERARDAKKLAKRRQSQARQQIRFPGRSIRPLVQ